MGALDKERIEGRFGPLWSGSGEILVAGRVRSLLEVKRTFDLMAADVVAIDLHELAEGGYAFRFYDGDDRRLVVYVFDAQWEISRAWPISEWLATRITSPARWRSTPRRLSCSQGSGGGRSGR